MSDYVSNSEQLSSTRDHKTAMAKMSNTWTLPGRPSTGTKKRRPMTEEDSKNFHDVRKQGACPKCHQTKKRCHPSHLPSTSRSAPSVTPGPSGHSRLEPKGSPRMETGTPPQAPTHGVLVRNVQEHTPSQAAYSPSSHPITDYRHRPEIGSSTRPNQPPENRKRSYGDPTGPCHPQHDSTVALDITLWEAFAPLPPMIGPTFSQHNPQLSADVSDIFEIPYSSSACLPIDDWLHDRNQSWNPLLNNLLPVVTNQAQPHGPPEPGLTFSGTTQSGSTQRMPPRPQSDSAYQYNQHAPNTEDHRRKRARSHVGIDQANTLFNLDELPELLLNPFDQDDLYTNDPVADLAADEFFFEVAQQQPASLDADILQDDGLMSQLAELFGEEPYVTTSSNEATGSLFTRDELDDIAQGGSMFSALVWNDPTPPPRRDSEVTLYTSNGDLSPDGTHDEEVFLAGLGTGMSIGSASSEEGKEQTLALRPKRAGFPSDDEG